MLEITTGISLPYAATIGDGLYIGHYGCIGVHEKVVIGKNCNISQGVSIGVSGYGENRGVPIIGDEVYIASNAVIAGKIKIGDGAVIAAGALILKDVPEKAVMIGNPARLASMEGSKKYIEFQGDDF